MYKFVVQKNNYEDYEYLETNTFITVDLKINKTQFELKLFSNDVFNYDNEEKKLTHLVEDKKVSVIYQLNFLF